MSEVDVVSGKKMDPVDDLGNFRPVKALVVDEQCSAAECVRFLRRFRQRSDLDEFESIISSIFVVDSISFTLQGQLSMQDLLLAPRLSSVDELKGPPSISFRRGDTLNDAADGLLRTGSLCAPVLDHQDVLLGIAAATTLARRLENRNQYLSLPISALARARLPWLASLLLLQSASSAILGQYQDLISQNVALALFLTMIIGTAGNAGNQSTASIIRAIATGEVSPRRDASHVLRREVLVSLVLASSLTILAFFRVSMSGSSVAASVSVSVALFFTTVLACIIGTLTPLAFETLGLDPANSSGPALATLTDVTGVMVLGIIAYLLLGQN